MSQKVRSPSCLNIPHLINLLTALLAEEFLNTTATQLTYHGLSELTSFVKDDEPSILFRNNHFITLYKHKVIRLWLFIFFVFIYQILQKHLFQLLTDQGFLAETNVVWETLNNIEGDGEFVDSDFIPVPPKPAESMMTPVDRQAQEDSDYLLALTLQEEDKKNVDKYKEWEQFKVETGMEGLTDEQLAKRLQDEEDSRMSTAPEESSVSHAPGSKVRHVSGSGKTALIHPQTDPDYQGCRSAESKSSSSSKVSNSSSSHHKPSRHPHHRHHSHKEESRSSHDPQPQPTVSSQPRNPTSNPSSSPNVRGSGSPQGAKRSGTERHSESGGGRESRSSGKKSCNIQ